MGMSKKGEGCTIFFLIKIDGLGSAFLFRLGRKKGKGKLLPDTLYTVKEDGGRTNREMRSCDELIVFMSWSMGITE